MTTLTPQRDAPRAEPTSRAEMAARKREADRRQSEAAARLQRPPALGTGCRDVLEERRMGWAAVLEADRDRVAALVSEIFTPERQARQPKMIIARVADAFGVTADEIIGRGKSQVVLQARFAAIAAIREAWPTMSSARIGRALGGRDHTTILHALARMAVRGVPQPPCPAGAA